MELMNNKYLIFDNIELENGQKVSNITQLPILPDIPDKYFSNDYILEYKVEDDKLLEGISFDLYENTDYWDILMVLNGMKRMDELPVNYDKVIERAQEKLSEWKKISILFTYKLNDEKIKEKYDDLISKEEENNEKFRNIKYISQGDLSELMAELDKLREEVKIDENLIINKEE